ncbi:MAG: alpha/beta hydrolase-fold protein [Bacteroidota bacterium]
MTVISYQEKYLPTIEVIANAFEIPELERTRRISALLPHDYGKTDKHYPVLYLQDGQNLADEHAPFGNWAVDKRLAILTALGKGDIIVIAIDHGEKDRISEYQPYKVKKWGDSEGKKYASWLVEKLKPYVDKNFRTLPGRENNGIGGSSMGGLISIYAGLMYPDIFSKLMIFSPSFWTTSKIFSDALNFNHPEGTHIYLYGGGKESKDMVPDIMQIVDSLESEENPAINTEIQVSIDPEGIHNEAAWGKEFPRALDWLYFYTKGNHEN